MDVDLRTLNRLQAYHLMVQTIVPRPVAWVLTDNGAQFAGLARWNLAPFSYFNGAASDPAQLLFSIGHGMDSREAKDTYVNLQHRADFVVHIPSVSDAQDVTASAKAYPHEESEVAVLGLDLAWPAGWTVPRLAQAKVALACTLDRFIPIAEGEQQQLVLARVGRMWVDDAVTTVDAKGRLCIDPRAVDPLARLGAGMYAAIGAPFNAS